MTAFFGVYLGFREASVGIFSSMLGHWVNPGHLHHNWVQYGVMGFAILLSWGAVVANLPVLSFTTFSSPIFGIIGCLLPVWLVVKTPDLRKYRKPSLTFITLIGLLLCISPFLAWM